MDTIDLEKGLASATAHPIISPRASSIPQAGAASDTRPPTPLELFQLLVGIATPPSLTRQGVDCSVVHGRAAEARQTSKALARTDNLGLYQRIKTEERRTGLAYVLTSYIGNTLFLVQIMLAATFTGLSAYKESTAVVLTILGTLNTVVAGCLAWQKGMGVPQRYRKAHDAYKTLLLEIEMAERAFIGMPADPAHDHGAAGAAANMPDPRAEKARLQKMFDDVHAEEQANYPDLYVSTSAPASTAAAAAKDVAKQIEEVKAEAEKAKDEAVAKVQAELTAQMEALMRRVEGKIVGDAGEDGPGKVDVKRDAQ